MGLTRIMAKAAKPEGRLLGLILDGAVKEIDITDDQLAAVQAAVDAGEVEVEGFVKSKPVDPPKAAPVAPASDKKAKG